METDNPFEKVLDRLREKGWMQGDFGKGSGPNCLVGAAKEALGRGWVPVIKELDKTVEAQYAERRLGRLCPIPNFNDHPDTTFTDVERVLEKAAVKWEEDRILRDD